MGMRYLHALILAFLMANPVAGQWVTQPSGSCPTPTWQSQFRAQISRAARDVRPDNEPLKYPDWMCKVEGGMGFHVGDGLVATCYHGSSKSVTYKGQTYPASYICGTPTNQGDIAILKTSAPFAADVRVCQRSPQAGASVRWQAGAGRVMGFSQFTIHTDCPFRLGDSGGPVWTREGVVSLVSATRPVGGGRVDSIGPSAELLCKYITMAREIHNGKGTPQQKDGSSGELLSQLDEIIARMDARIERVEGVIASIEEFEQTIDRATDVATRIEQAAGSGTDAGPSQSQTQAISVAISQSLANNQQFLQSVQGERGPEGKRGPQGATGAKGERGPEGKQGPPGEVDAAAIQIAVEEALAGQGITVRTVDKYGNTLDSEFIPLGGVLNIQHRPIK